MLAVLFFLALAMSSATACNCSHKVYTKVNCTGNATTVPLVMDANTCFGNTVLPKIIGASSVAEKIDTCTDKSLTGWHYINQDCHENGIPFSETLGTCNVLTLSNGTKNTTFYVKSSCVAGGAPLLGVSWGLLLLTAASLAFCWAQN